ncbi:cytochrome-c peroxidase [Neolewinella antarctica]|uniref:Cytochrome c peroxidase n=1 Tax=Neolewinella antarctica TaxID=442734 RepID=A0ABX0XD24_9BACT|nr:cytochrome c peroxidase [Neolewinella antarctica]NJC26687.1 cytochrome c peroxidase [Neolewinella antarctica]
MLLLSTAGCVRDEALSPLDAELERTLIRLSASGSLRDFVLPDGSDLSGIPAGVSNPLTQEKVALGKLLFYETALGRDAIDPEQVRTFSCSTCHVPEAAFTAGSAQGIADGGRGFGVSGAGRTMNPDYAENDIDAQGARPLSMLGVAYVTNSMWAGRFGAHGANAEVEEVWGVFDPATEVNHLGLDGLEAQNIEGTVTHRMSTDEFLLDTLGYRPLFDRAFPEFTGDAKYGRVALSFALSAYIRTILPNEAPWQQWLRGDRNALTEAQKRGAQLFFGKAGCYRCHQGPALNGNAFYALGVNDLCDVPGVRRTGLNDTRNLGRGDFTRRADDLYKFKVPQLYNTKDMPYYFHGSSKQNLREVVAYFNDGVIENERVPAANVAAFFQPLNLSAVEIDELTEFLAEGLYDANLSRYVPEAVLSGACFPNSDAQSRVDMGCD